ncbi:hypothetical protein PLESTB_000804000 [Pleodorina starrii]|uniref:Uncharacterized protein n=1 Tax=Pleodorina starrii TaxID=330485 RepID=A0A9W6BLG3_9CHLO|nr:hypothetical protein PLESTB_000804000 [Pleodorina starrii]
MISHMNDIGAPSQSLVGCMLGELVALPRGASKPEDLLFASTFKKSSLKARSHEARVKVGPVHVVQATHQDGAPLSLEVQVVGKPGPNEIMTAVLKVHQPPMMPTRRLFAPPLPHTAAETGTARSPALLAEAAPVGPRPSDAGAVAPPSSAAVAVTAAAAYGHGLDRPPSVYSLSTPPAAASRASRVDLGSPTMEPPSASQQANQPHTPSDLGRPGLAPSAAAVQLAGRSKLAGMVQSLGEDKAASSERSSGARSKKESGRCQQASASNVEPTTPSPQCVLEECPIECLDVPGKVATGYTPLSEAGLLLVHDLDSGRAFCGGEQDDGKVKQQEKSTGDLADGRILKWVASEGAFFQNSDPYAAACSRHLVNGGDAQPGVGSRASGDNGLLRRSSPAPSPLQRDNKRLDPEPQLLLAKTVVGSRTRRSSSGSSTGDDMQQTVAAAAGDIMDDAGSEAGQSAVSGSPSATGSEYTRGKRVRKLAKIMDSSEVQQVQKRLRIHALMTVAALAVAHIVCFALTVLAVKSQRSAMLQLGNSVLAQQHMQRVMINVRSLDNIATGKWSPNVYTPQDAPAFVNRVGYHAGEAMARIIDILTEHSGASTVKDLLYNSKKAVWDSNGANGSDVYANLTILDFGTRFYIMAKNIEQYHDSWVKSVTRIANTAPGQFLLKSGPDFFGEFRKVMDALLHNLVNSTRLVENQQIIFLVVEGAALSFVAACYLAYLLRAVAAQRYKLYGTFLVIPLGLTRALASQNTNLNLEGDDDTDDDEDEDQQAAQTPAAAVAQLPFGADDDNAVGQKLTRRAKLRVQEAEAPSVPVAAAAPDAVAAAWEGSGKPLTNRRRGGPHLATATGTNLTSDDLRVSRGGEDNSGHRRSRRHSTLSSGDLAEYDRPGCWGWLGTWRQRFWRALVRRLLRRRTSTIHPFPQHALMAGGGSASFSEHGGGKRRLVLDSNETIIMLLPFIVWSVLVITIYSVAVVKLRGIDDVVALHSVTNFMAARTTRSVFFSQELVSVDSPAQLPAKRAVLLAAIKLVRDAWFTLQLGADAYLSAGNDVERFPLVTKGLVTSSPELLKMLYDTGTCHRTGEHLPCPGSNYRFFTILYTSLASIAQQHMMSLKSLATNTSMIPPGLQNDNFDFIYNVGYVDLVDGALTLKEAYSDTIMAKFDVILLLHIALFLLFWFIIAGFLVFQLYPLLRRISEERRRVAELMSQLPLELDVERLVGRALMLAAANTSSSAGAADASVHEKTDLDGTSRWKAIIRAGSSMNAKAASMDGSYSVRKKG